MYAYAKDGLFFKVFKEIDPVSKVPVKGSWIVLIPIVLGAFCLNLR
jgi:amino acid transporter